MSSARKRRRSGKESWTGKDAEPAEIAECPYEAITIDPEHRADKKKRVRTDGGDSDAHTRKNHLQHSPFKPTGEFKTYKNMDVEYQVKPTKDWASMTRYNSFVLNGIRYTINGYVRVRNNLAIERQEAIAEEEQLEPLKNTDEEWVARILEIRAKDEHNVFARVYWMYWPNELPRGTRDGKKFVQGRQPYHGAQELIASNHMDIINVVSVTDDAEVKQMFEDNDEEIHESLYWRQAYDVRTNELSSLQLICKCQRPSNPDKLLIGCSTEKCRAWMHSECIIRESLLEVYTRLGTDKPHDPVGPEKHVKLKEAVGEASPAETRVTEAQHSNDDEPSDERASEAMIILTKDNFGVVSKGTLVPAPLADSNDQNRADTPNMATIATPGQRGRLRKSEANRQTARGTPSKPNGRPYEGLFDASLLLDVSPPILVFTDLRANVQGEAKKWQEHVKCLVCGTQIS